MVLNIAHRGASAECPENTLAAFRRAIDLGADYLELDLRFSKDGGMVVIHDETVDRTMAGRGAVSQMSLIELDRLTSVFPVESGFHKERIPTLREVIQIAQSNPVGLLVEIKSSQHLTETFLQDLCRLLSSSNLGSRVILQSFDCAILLKLKILASFIPTALVWDRPCDNLLSRALELGNQIVSVKAKWLHSHLVFKAHGAGLRVFSWTVNSHAEIDRMIRLGVDGIISDYPDRVAQAIRSDSDTLKYNPG